MNSLKYLDRIGLDHFAINNDGALSTLHLAHVTHVPFENLDIHYRKMFDLKIDNIYNKVVVNNRGGFCYELNLLFNELLNALGFRSRIIEARIFTERGEAGPPFDHMALHVTVGNKEFLADVGFGDLFVKPLELREGIQTDGRNSFKIEHTAGTSYVLSMAKPNHSFEKKYVFDLRTVHVSDFIQPCIDKQTSPESYFVKNLVCTRPTTNGRVTVFNNMLFEKNGSHRSEIVIVSDEHLRKLLEEHFSIVGIP